MSVQMPLQDQSAPSSSSPTFPSNPVPILSPEQPDPPLNPPATPPLALVEPVQSTVSPPIHSHTLHPLQLELLEPNQTLTPAKEAEAEASR
jgi:hypothetical protein